MDLSVSVIVPVYNAKGTLRKCVESIAYGNEKNIEIILVDDCSTDGSWELCNRLSQELVCVKCFQNEKNSGVSHTRNAGLDKVNAPYIMFVDSDDWVSSLYISKMLSLAESNKEKMIICGFHYINEMDYSSVDYIWDKNQKNSLCEISDDQLFLAVDRIALQNIWNKIFRTDLIQQYNIIFDETQSMGEDFRFVLDYMSVLKDRQCLIINEALYYYVRANTSSLMSKFGWTSNQYSIDNLKILSQLSSKENRDKNLNAALKQNEKNIIYHVCRTPKKTKKEKLFRIKEVTDCKQPIKYYNVQRRLYVKEKVCNILQCIKDLNARIKGKIQREKREKIIRNAREKYLADRVSIISQNCIGGVFYHDMNRKFLSPTINLYFEQTDFIKFVKDMKKYVSLDIKMKWGEKYPIGYLDDVKIHFMHYNNCTEAKESWNRRCSRINWDKILILNTDMEGFDDTIFEQWKFIDLPKILFTAHEKYSKEPSSVYYPIYKNCSHVPDLIPNREFYKDNQIISYMNQTFNNRSENG